MSISYVFALVGDKKRHHQRITILVTSRSRMQQPNAGSTKASSEPVRICALVQAAMAHIHIGVMFHEQ